MVKKYEAGEVYSDGKTPVPSYDEYKRLQEQIKEANEVIKKYAYPKSVCKSIIENQMVCEVIAYTEPKEGLDYLEKWGVK